MSGARAGAERKRLGILLGLALSAMSATVASAAHAQHALLAPGDKTADIARLVERARSGGTIEPALCERVLLTNAWSCRVQGELGGGRFLLVSVKSYDGTPGMSYSMLLDTVSEHAIPAPRILWLDVAGQRVFVHSEHAVRVFDFVSSSWQYVGDCLAAEVAPDHASLACVGYDESLSRIALASPFTRCERVSNTSTESRLADTGYFEIRIQRVTIAFESRPGGDFHVVASILHRRSGDVVVQRPGRPRAHASFRETRVADAWNSTSARCENGAASASAVRADEGPNITRFETLDRLTCAQLVSQRLAPAASCRVWTHAASGRRVVEVCNDIRPNTGTCIPSRLGRPTIFVTNPARPSSFTGALFLGDVVLVGVLGAARTLVLTTHTGLWSFDYEENTLRFLGRCWHAAVSATHAAVACIDATGHARVYARRGTTWAMYLSSDRAPVPTAGIAYGEVPGAVRFTGSNAFLEAKVWLFTGVHWSRETVLAPPTLDPLTSVDVRVALPNEARAWFGAR